MIKKNILVYLFIFLSLYTWGQTTITIGTDNTTNGNTTYPAPYGNYYDGAKHQIIIRASELNAAGMTAGNIQSLAFNVATVNGVAMTNFSVAMGQTSKTEWNPNDDFETGLTTVFSSSSYTETSGWNTHSFSTPFYWDGLSNLIIETCFENTNYTSNAQMFYSSTSYNSVLYYRRDNQPVCSVTQNNFSFSESGNRPNIQFQWEAPNVPPVTDFSASSITTCSGQIHFLDQSSGNPTAWSWDFGDGNTSTQQNPSHTYTTSGVYTVQLTATNQFGSHTETKTNYITVNLSAQTPVVASCTPMTQNGTLGFGITNVSFNTINEASGDASEGYLDNTCSQTTVFAGQTYPITIQHAQPTTHNCVAWIDYNNDGMFDDLTEKIISNTSALSTTGNVTIASNAVLNTPLRMRVVVDYDLNAVPTPCTNPTYGQAEDYTIIVEQDTSPPVGAFESNEQVTCDGVIEFSDLSTNIPTTWLWDFGDGSTSIQQHPQHAYTTSGTYDIMLVVSNQFGVDTIVYTNHIEVNLDNNLVPAQCSPATLGHCCGYGIYLVQFNVGFNPAFGFSSYSNGAEEGYQDYSCLYNDSIVGGSNYPLEIRTGVDNPQDTRVWIDFNNDGAFDNSEIVFESLNSYNPTGNIVIPSTGVVWDTPLRMRVLSDEVGATLNSCSDLTRGQVEDYLLKITEPEVDTTSIAETTRNVLAIYPNPTNGMINVSNTFYKLESVMVYTIDGQLVKAVTIEDGELFTQLNLRDAVNGVYLLQVQFTNGMSQIEKIIIRK